jgi:RNA polymerase sigma-70 factor (ECF subfamily)
MLPAIVETSKKAAVEVFERVFRDHYGLVYRTAYTITRRAEDAEDVAQAIFLRLLRREFDPRATTNLKGYLYKSAVNASLRTLQSRQRDVVTEGISCSGQSRASENSDSAESMDRRLWTAIAELHETAAQAVVLRYIQGHSVSETARLLGKSRSVIAVTLFRSRSRLKKLIGDSEGEE